MLRTILARFPAALHARQFSSSQPTRKTVTEVTEKVSELAEKVNKSLGRGLASAVEAGEEATEKAKETVVGAKKGTEKVAEKMGNVAKHKKDKAGAEINSAKEEMKDATRK